MDNYIALAVFLKEKIEKKHSICWGKTLFYKNKISFFKSYFSLKMSFKTSQNLTSI